MSRLIYIIFLSIIFLEGCKSPLEKFIFSPLTTQELDKIVEEDVSFLNTYSLIESKSNQIFSSKDSSRFKGITYLRLHNYLKEISNKHNNSIITSNARSEWSERYKIYNSQVDSVIKNWEKFITASSPDSLASIQYIGYKTEKIRVKNKITNNIRLQFKIKSLKQNIDSVKAIYALVDSSLMIIPDSTNTGNIFKIEYKRRVRDSVITSVIFNPAESHINTDSLIENNLFFIGTSVESVYSDNICYNKDTIRNMVPQNVLTLIDNKENSTQTFFDETIYRDLIIREQINPNFLSQEAYVKNSLENYHKNLDTLVYNYINYNQL